MEFRLVSLVENNAFNTLLANRDFLMNNDDRNKLAIVCLDLCNRAADWAGQQKRDDRLTSAAGDWFESNLPEQNFETLSPESFEFGHEIEMSLWWILEPIADYFAEESSVSWCGVGARFFPDGGHYLRSSEGKLRFHYWAKRKILDGAGDHERLPQRWIAQSLLSQLAPFQDTPPYEIALTSDICLNHLDDGTPLVISRNGECQNWDGSSWIVNAEPLCLTIQNHIADLEKHVGEYQTANSHIVLERLDDMLAEILAKISNSKLDLIPRKGATQNEIDKITVELGRGRVPYLAFAKYLALMTMVEEDWTRIVMLPQPNSIKSAIQPGGIIVCESTQADESISPEKWQQIARLVGQAFSQWQIVVASSLANNEKLHAAFSFNYHECMRSLTTIRDRIKIVGSNWQDGNNNLTDLISDESIPPELANRLVEIQSELEEDVGALQESEWALEYSMEVLDGVSDFVSGKGNDRSLAEYMKFLDQSVKLLARTNSIRPNCISTYVDERIEMVDQRLFILTVEAIRNAIKHRAESSEITAEVESHQIDFQVQLIDESNIKIICNSHPHELLITDPDGVFGHPPDISRGIGLLKRLAKTLGGNSEWNSVKTGPETLESDIGLRGKFRVAYTYVGPFEFKKAAEKHG